MGTSSPVERGIKSEVGPVGRSAFSHIKISSYHIYWWGRQIIFQEHRVRLSLFFFTLIIPWFSSHPSPLIYIYIYIYIHILLSLPLIKNFAQSVWLWIHCISLQNKRGRPGYDTKLYLIVRLHFWRCVEYLFSAITSRSTLTWSVSIC